MLNKNKELDLELHELENQISKQSRKNWEENERIIEKSQEVKSWNNQI